MPPRRSSCSALSVRHLAASRLARIDLSRAIGRSGPFVVDVEQVEPSLAIELVLVDAPMYRRRDRSAPGAAPRRPIRNFGMPVTIARHATGCRPAIARFGSNAGRQRFTK
jgi:hypothetical protein